MTPAALSRLGPPVMVILLGGPIGLGLLFTLLPAFGYLPALGGNVFSLEPFRRLFAEPGLWTSAGLSLWTGLAATFASVFLTAAFLAAWSGTQPFRAIERLLGPLLALPHAAAAFGLAFLIAPSGLFFRALSPTLAGWTTPPDLLIVNDPLGLALVAGLVAKEVPFLLLVALAAMPQADPERRMLVSASLGYGRMAGFLFTVWPTLYRQMRLGVFAVVAFSSSVVDVAAILGPTTPPTLSLRLVRWSADPDLSFRFLASAGALLQLGVSALAILVWIGIERIGRRSREILAANGHRFAKDRAMRWLALVFQALILFALVAGILALLLWSFAGLWPFPDLLPSTFSIQGWSRLLPRLIEPLGNAALIGVFSALLALLLALLCLLREDATGLAPRWRSPLLYLPLIVPQAAFLFGLQLMALWGGFAPNVLTLTLVHLVFVAPYLFLALAPAWSAYDPRYEQVAASLGRGPWTILRRIKLLMLSRAVLASLAIGFAVSVGLYLPTLLIGAGRITTITTEAVALASGGNRRVVGAYALAQMLLPALGFLATHLVGWLVWRRP
ncbi:MAG: ABC transporter permease [Methylobacterium mesophilicum]|nr:ABC transporter permease [Methylobacterium mesophilicum]